MSVLVLVLATAGCLDGGLIDYPNDLTASGEVYFTLPEGVVNLTLTMPVFAEEYATGPVFPGLGHWRLVSPVAAPVSSWSLDRVDVQDDLNTDHPVGLQLRLSVEAGQGRQVRLEVSKDYGEADDYRNGAFQFTLLDGNETEDRWGGPKVYHYHFHLDHDQNLSLQYGLRFQRDCAMEWDYHTMGHVTLEPGWNLVELERTGGDFDC